MTRRWGHLLFWLVLAAGVAADLLTKHFAFSFLLGLSESGTYDARVGYDVWPGVFSLLMKYNTGGPFSLLSGQNAMLIIVTLAAVGVILYLYAGTVRSGGRLAVLSLALIAAGALGNVVDRVHGGRVRDFINFYVISYPVFNVADVLITIGAALLVIRLFRRETPRRSTDAGRVETSR